MKPKQIAMQTLENDVLSLELAKLYVAAKKYCEMSQNSKMAVHKKYWDAVMSQIKILDKVVEL